MPAPIGIRVAHVENKRIAAAHDVPRGGDIYPAKTFRLPHDQSSFC